MLDYVTGPQYLHLHMYHHLVDDTTGYLLEKEKNFLKYRNVTKTLGGGVGRIAPWWGYEFACMSEENTKEILSQLLKLRI